MLYPVEMIAIRIRRRVIWIPVCVLGDLSVHSGSNMLLYFFASSTKYEFDGY